MLQPFDALVVNKQEDQFSVKLQKANASRFTRGRSIDSRPLFWCQL
jgi:hypothetical protein